jgi:hypothetical protein
MSRNECFFSRFEFYMFYVLYPFMTNLLILRHILLRDWVIAARVLLVI